MHPLEVGAWDNHHRRRSVLLWSSAVCLLLLPWLAMQFTKEMAWDAGDFAIVGAMLIAVCGAYELAVRKTSNRACLAAVAIALATAFILIWMNLAMGIIGSEDNPANLMYGGVLVVATVGSFLARFHPRGMARAMIATAIAQLLVAVIAFVAGYGEAFILTALFMALWLVSARLFMRAQQDPSAHR
jgi:hypothetical protein